MRFQCDQCQKIYKLPDERVRGRILKIRCKQCQHLMTIKGPAQSELTPSSDELKAQKTIPDHSGAQLGVIGLDSTTENIPAISISKPVDPSTHDREIKHESARREMMENSVDHRGTSPKRSPIMAVMYAILVIGALGGGLFIYNPDVFTPPSEEHTKWVKDAIDIKPQSVSGGSLIALDASISALKKSSDATEGTTGEDDSNKATQADDHLKAQAKPTVETANKVERAQASVAKAKKKSKPLKYSKGEVSTSVRSLKTAPKKSTKKNGTSSEAKSKTKPKPKRKRKAKAKAKAKVKSKTKIKAKAKTKTKTKTRAKVAKKTPKKRARSSKGPGLPNSTVQQIVRQNSGGIQYCYNKARKKDPNMGDVRTNLSFRILPEGMVNTSRISLSGVYRKSRLEGCIRMSVSRWRFPTAKGETKVRYPLNFKAGF